MLDMCVRRLCIFHMQTPESKNSVFIQLIYEHNVTKQQAILSFFHFAFQATALYFIGFLPYYLNWIRE